MKRREFIALLSVATIRPLTVAAQQSRKVPRVGILSPAAQSSTLVFQAFRQGLRDLGYVEGNNILLEFRLGGGSFDPLPALAADLVRLPVDVILTEGGIKAAQIAREATGTIPIVTPTGSELVRSGLAVSFAKPAGNITGLSLLSAELNTKRLELIKELLPTATKVAVLWNPLTGVNFLQGTQEAARALHIDLVPVEADTRDQLHIAFKTIERDQGHALLVLPDAIFWNERIQIIQFVGKSRLPAVYPEREYADDGGLIGYGPNVPDNFRRAAGYVDKILKGAKPGDLPIEQPTKFDTIVNLRTAKALGLMIPTSILLRADEVIE